MKYDLQILAHRLGHQFKDIALLEQALRHRSFGTPHNERLEFLGDAILGFVISSELFNRQKKAKEGELSRMRSSLVNGEELASLALDLQLNDYLSLGPGERKSGGEFRHSILADAMEAIIGAIYLDGGLEEVRQCILRWYGEKVNDLGQLVPIKDAKSKLQEWLQARRLPLPQYQATMSGEAHALTFKVICKVEGLPYETEGISSNRRKAEQMAATRYLELLNERE